MSNEISPVSVTCQYYSSRVQQHNERGNENLIAPELVAQRGIIDRPVNTLSINSATNLDCKYTYHRAFSLFRS